MLTGILCVAVTHDGPDCCTALKVFDEGHFTGKNEGFVISVAFLRSSYKINGVTKFTDFW